jgi:hypothetical protein
MAIAPQVKAAPKAAPAAAPKQAPTAAPKAAPPSPAPAPAIQPASPKPPAAAQAKPPQPQAATPVQAKSALPTSQPGDAAEREADARATRVMRSAEPARGARSPAPPTSQGSTQGPLLSPEHQSALGAGEPLPADVRALMEPRFGESLAEVRLLTDGAAAAAADSIQARAFTLGHRIGFAAGQYQPSTPDGQWLLAHEIAHVLQQQSGSVPRQVMRDATTPGSGGGAAGAGGPSGGLTRVATTGAPRYRLQTALRVPPIKGRHSPTYATLARNGGLVRSAGYDASVRGTAQVPIWLANVLPDLTQMPANHRPSAGGSWNVTLERNGAAVRTVTAPNDAALREQLARPAWNAEGVDTNFQVDHMIEYQLGGNDHQDNMELLDQQHNGSVGSSFAAEIRRAIRLELAAGRLPPPISEQPAPSASMDISQVMQRYDIEFSESTGRARNTRHTEGGASFWSAADIRTLQPLRELLPPRADGLAGSSSALHVLSPSGNLVVLRLPVRSDAVQVPAPGTSNIAGFEIDAVSLPGGMASMSGTAGRAGAGELQGRLNLGAAVSVAANAARYALPLDKAEGMEHTLRISATPGGPPGEPGNATLQTDFRPLSPMAITGIRAGSAIEAQATITPSHPALQDLRLPAQVRNGRVGLFHTIDASALAAKFSVIPGLTLESAAITLGYDGENFSVEGGCDFSIRNFGTGYLNAMRDSAGNFALEGGLSADTRLFDRAAMRLWYRSRGGFGGEGTLAITNPDKIRGIRSASVNARYENGVFSATGSVEPNIPGLQSAGLTVRYGPDAELAQSLLIAGDLQLAAGVPCVRSGSVHVEVLQRDETWQVSANGELQPAIPGVNATLRARYAQGAFTASVEAPFRIGERVTGNLLVGVSNVASGPNGTPQEGATPGGRLLAFGQGSATVRLSDNLQGNFGIRVPSDGGVRIDGEFVLPQPIPIFAARDFNRVLLPIPTVAIPIFGAAAGDSVAGVAALIGGSINAVASVGPGEIDRGRIGIRDFNPAQPESLHVTGNVRFRVPATAGVNGRLTASISAGAVVIRADGELAVQLSLGVDATAATDLDLDWTQAQGLVLAATLRANVSPKLRASVTGAAQVLVNAFVTTYTLWRKEYVIAEREFGSALSVGISVPATWRERGGLDFDINRVQFEIPPITPDGALAALLLDEGSEAAAPVEASSPNASFETSDPNASFPPTSPNASFSSGDDRDLVCH